MRVTRHTAADVDRELYLAGLHSAFPGWGDERRFAWCFERALAGRTPDLLLLHDGDVTIAGSAVTYRMLQLRDGSQVRTGIMTASWTLPEGRGRGAFSRMIGASRELSPLLLAFVTAENASRRRLDAAGALAVPSFYCRRATSLPMRRDRAARFVYEPEEWRSQFLDRPEAVEWIERPQFSIALEGDRVLFVDGDRDAALHHLVQHGREVFCFSTGVPVSDDFTPGFVMVFGLDEGDWDIQNGDRM